MLYYLGYPLSYSINGFPDFGSVGEMKKEVKKKKPHNNFENRSITDVKHGNNKTWSPN